jgi:2-methylisocitrate lyase-like PEP mutase family enzyme
VSVVAAQRAKAERLRALHRAPPILVLPNAWDAASAAAFAALDGCRALATSSGAIAAAHGHPDGERIPRDEMLAVVARIASAVDVPVTADLEAGYGDAAGTAEAAIEAGAAGLNLEDGLGPVEEHVERIRAVRAVAGSAGVPLVVNARTDVFLRGDGNVDEAVRRGNAYLAAGADCVFPIMVTEADAIRRLAAEIRGPVNVLHRPGVPGVAELERLGVARVSVGSGLYRAALAHAETIVRDLLASAPPAPGPPTRARD